MKNEIIAANLTQTSFHSLFNRWYRVRELLIFCFSRLDARTFINQQKRIKLVKCLLKRLQYVRVPKTLKKTYFSRSFLRHWQRRGGVLLEKWNKNKKNPIIGWESNAERIWQCRYNSTVFVRGNLTASHPWGVREGVSDINSTWALVGDFENNPL